MMSGSGGLGRDKKLSRADNFEYLSFFSWSLGYAKKCSVLRFPPSIQCIYKVDIRDMNTKKPSKVLFILILYRHVDCWICTLCKFYDETKDNGDKMYVTAQ